MHSAECAAAGMRISTSRSEATVPDQKKVVFPLQVGKVSLSLTGGSVWPLL